MGHPVHWVEDDEIWLDGDGTRTLALPAAPVSTIAVELDGAALVAGRDYTISRRAGILSRPAGWPDGLENIRVTYTHGYKVIPGGIEDAVLEQAATQALVLAHIASETALGQSVTYGAQAMVGVTQKWTDAVEKYTVGGPGSRS